GIAPPFSLCVENSSLLIREEPADRRVGLHPGPLPVERHKEINDLTPFGVNPLTDGLSAVRRKGLLLLPKILDQKISSGYRRFVSLIAVALPVIGDDLILRMRFSDPVKNARGRQGVSLCSVSRVSTNTHCRACVFELGILRKAPELLIESH